MLNHKKKQIFYRVMALTLAVLMVLGMVTGVLYYILF